ncbi:WD40 repeat domain-containing protein [Streptomyces sp. NPDC002766]|uniref:WD40 repeat domain-containing protein n=1 Tax=Streptomyces sp. NPDC002766 TaxID=3154429 RepID=UPI00331B118C
MLKAVEVLTINTGHSEATRPILVPGTEGPGLLVSITGMQPIIHGWDIATGASLWSFTEELPGVNDAVLAGLPDGRSILAVSTEDGVERWSGITGAPLDGVDSSEWTIWGMDAGTFPGGRTVLLGAGHNHAVFRWDAISGEQLGAPLRGHETSVRAVGLVGLSATDAVIVSGDDAGYLRRWDAITGDPIGVPVEGHGSLVSSISRLPAIDGRSLFASTDAEGEVSRWDAVTGERVGDPLKAGSDAHLLTTACPGGIPLLLSAGPSSGIQAWHAWTGEAINLSLPGVSVAALDQPDGTTLIAVGASQGEIRLYSVSE